MTTRQAYDKARRARDKALRAYLKARPFSKEFWQAYEALGKAQQAFEKTWRDYDEKAVQAFDEARREVRLPTAARS